MTTPVGFTDTTKSSESFKELPFWVKTSTIWERKRQQMDVIYRHQRMDRGQAPHCQPSLDPGYLVVSGWEAEFAEGSLVAVRHVGPAAEEHHSAGVSRQGTPKHLDAVLLLEEETKEEVLKSRALRSEDSPSHEE